MLEVANFQSCFLPPEFYFWFFHHLNINKSDNFFLSVFILLQREGGENKIWAILYPNIRNRQDRGNGVNFTKTETV
jgi:hypothetical protein